MNWIRLTDMSQLEEIDALSNAESRMVAIFKHSTRCSISSMALNRIDRVEASMPAYFLDLIAHRDISNAIADRYSIEHESPQLLIIQGKKVIFHSSHTMIKPAHLQGNF
jgi:bacillithiol system protein YtxJ